MDLDWNDLRHFLAVARSGSTLAAGRKLRVSQTTVARRIAALEESLKLTLFDRRQAGYALTPLGQELLRHAEAVEAAATRFGDAAAASARDTSGRVSVTTQEIFAVTLLAPWLRELHETNPEIVIDLDTTEEVRDLGGGAADVALRATTGEQPAGTVGRRLCVDDWALYCSRDYAQQHGVPAGREDLRHHSIVGGGGEKVWRQYLAWLQDLGLEDRVTIHHGSALGLLSGVRSGVGIGVLPCIVADAEPDLVRCFPPRSDHGRVMWLLTHERVRHTPRVRTVADFLYARLKQHIRQLERKTAAA